MKMFDDNLIYLNGNLSEENKRIISEYSAPQFPVTFIMTQPRAASTLFNQLLFTRYKIGYVSNIIAKFWDAPAFGVTLHRELEVDGQGSSYASGLIPPGAIEPHEWGFFWRKWLNLDKGKFYCQDLTKIDWDGLKATIAMMEDYFEAPMIYDSPFFHGNVDGFKKAFPHAVFLKVFREPFFICNSIINARIARHGDINGFYGNHPRKIDEILALTDPIEQIVMQVYETENEINQVLEAIPKANRIIIDYPEMMNNPTKVVDEYKECLMGLGYELHPTNIDLPKSLPLRDTEALMNKEYKGRLCDKFEEYFGYLPSGYNL